MTTWYELIATSDESRWVANGWTVIMRKGAHCIVSKSHKRPGS